MTALAWIVKEAKRLRRKFPKRFVGKNAWRRYVAQASAIYASKHKGKSPVGKKRRKKIGSTKFVEKSESTRTKPSRTIRVTRTKKGRYKSFAAIGATPGRSKNYIVFTNEGSFTIAAFSRAEAASRGRFVIRGENGTRIRNAGKNYRPAKIKFEGVHLA